MLALLFVLSTFISSPPAAAANPTLIQAPAGPIVGLAIDGTYVYRGIPYAAAPLGERRWAPPAPLSPWTRPLNAVAYGPKCPQLISGSFPVYTGKEDCLFLNLWRPAAKTAAPLPVLVFIHGGANSIGSASEEFLGVRAYDGRYLSQEGPAVVVTFNYRLGALGFMAHPALSRESAYHGSGNYGLLDQVQALHWVRDNIAAFGGDPANVTLFGESAGAIDTLALMASPLADGLFKRAIVQSGFLTEIPLKAAEEAGTALAGKAGCAGDSDETLRCLRQLTAEDLVRASGTEGAPLTSFSLTIDGHALPVPVLESLRSPRGGARRLIIGTNADEMTTLGPAVARTDRIQTAEDFRQAIRSFFGESAAPAIFAAYPLADYSSPRNAIESLLADYSTHCPSRRVARAVGESGASVWRYLFAHVPEDDLLAPYGASHGFELPYVFHNLNPLTTTPREEKLSREIAGLWLAFARTGEPGSSRIPWPASRGGTNLLKLDVVLSTLTDFRAPQCEFWDANALEKTAWTARHAAWATSERSQRSSDAR